MDRFPGNVPEEGERKQQL